jgi:hypothetical protein
MIANALPRPLTAGFTDNAILRADGTSGATLQNSGLIVEDTIVSFAVTGNAITDIITATGSAFANGQPVRFTTLTGGAGLFTTNYYVINVSGATFQVSTSVGGAASLFTTDITVGTLLTGHSVSTNVTLSENTTETNSALVLTPKGTGAFILGPKPDGTATGGNVRGARAVDLQTNRTAATQVAAGPDSFVAGFQNTTSNPAWAIGLNNTASGIYSTAIGRQCVASNSNTIALGFQGTASGNSSVAFSLNSVADRYAMFSAAAGVFVNSGDAQRARFVMRNKTTTNAAVELFLDGSATRLTVPSGKVFAFTINIAGVSSTGGAVAHYMRQYCLKNVAGTTSEVYAPITIGTDNAAGTSIAISASDANDSLVVSVTGTASTIWRWVASVDAVEIAFGT